MLEFYLLLDTEWQQHIEEYVLSSVSVNFMYTWNYHDNNCENKQSS